MKQSGIILSELKNELRSFETTIVMWKNSGHTLITERTKSSWNPDSYSALTLNSQFNEARAYLDQAEDLIGNYALQVTDGFKDKKSALFSLYSLLLLVFLLVIIYLGRKIIWLQNEMLEEQTLYQLIGETMSDFIILTDPNGLILYASPHTPVF